jgi:aldose 1-epimerase
MTHKSIAMLLLAAAVLCLYGCNNVQILSLEKTKMNITKKSFGKTPDGEKVDLYTLTNAAGSKAQITNYGGIVTSLQVADRQGELADIVLGYDNLDDYIKASPYFGSIIGRYGNRIGKGQFTIDANKYTLATNNGPNHLHGGIKGFDKVVWKAEPIKSTDEVALKLTYLSPDGEEGYPGNLNCTVIYMLTNKNELKISYEAETDKPTIINLTNHSYFNLAGHDSGNVLGHEIMINADHFTPVDEGLIPTGEIRAVKDSPMDFTKLMPIGSRIAKVKGGYDHNYVLNRLGEERSLSWAVTVYEPVTGRKMEIFTTEPGVQFYTGNFLDGSNKGKGATYNKHAGFCLETQHFPDSPNKAHFPSVILRPGEQYMHLTIHKFSAE